MRWGPLRAAAAAAAASFVLPLLLLQLFPQPSYSLRACSSSSSRSSIAGPYLAGGAPSAFISGPLSGSRLCLRASRSQQQQQQRNYVNVATAAAAAGGGAPAPGGEGGSPQGAPGAPGGPPPSLSDSLDTAADARIRDTVAAAAQEGDGILCVSSKEDEAEAEAEHTAAAAAAAGAALTPEALNRAAQTFDPTKKQLWSQGCPLGGPYGGGPYGGPPGLQPGAPGYGGPMWTQPGAPQIRPGGPLEALALCMQKGLDKGTAWLRRWKENEERVLPVLLSKLEENAAITIGQKTVVQLPEQQRMHFVENMKELGAAAVILGYAEMDEGAAGAAAGEAARAAAARAAAQGSCYTLVGYKKRV
ncbi:hypothetical protein, conserved [Eimeria maxima]|uniref:Uncharacterized protein n=1 Tax=Eimeria maxima TaxID=5804 RepID=U6MBQ8_EIMMA|nr:hypothetical protein, conserved [Eimeria maxima]CDJ59075.1 hypothetical protein, conserved [Eimeria maxima]